VVGRFGTKLPVNLVFAGGPSAERNKKMAETAPWAMRYVRKENQDSKAVVFPEVPS
jgi:hypothetical protein